uniref:Rho-related GTP-binding protein RhoE n=1 Tax=Magallana gigas TaxID=29159 RepID=A0A8W8MSR8_MAGGI
MTSVKCKIVIVGDSECGKTSLIQRYIKENFNEVYSPTAFDTYNTTYHVSETYRIQMSLWDTSVAEPDSMDHAISRWSSEVREHCPKQPIILVGCKTDLRTDAATVAELAKRRTTPIMYDQALKTAKQIGALVYSEISSKDSQRSVNDVIEVAALSSAGNKTTPEQSPTFRRQRSFMRRKRFNGMGEATVQLRKEAAKSCSIM